MQMGHRVPWFVVCLSVVFCGLSLPTHAMGLYAKAGVLGAGAGYFHGVTDHVSLRADFASVPRLSHDVASRIGSYIVRADAKQWGGYGDWFPFGHGFRLSVGVNVRKLQAQAVGHPADGALVIKIWSIKYSVKFSPEDTFTAQVKFPTVAPYLGIGWGYHDMQEPGWGFVFDLGVSFGKPSASLVVSSSLQAKIKLAKLLNVASVDALLNTQRQNLDDTARKFKVFPQVYVGVSYRF